VNRLHAVYFGSRADALMEKLFAWA